MFQNSNNSVRVTDDFMDAVIRDKEWHTRAVTSRRSRWIPCKARELMREMAEAAHLCGDPGIQFDTTVNDWHTCAELRAHQRQQPLLGIHVPRRQRVQPGLAEPDEASAKPTGEFDVEAFRHAVAIMIIAQEIIIDRASYPTPADHHQFQALPPAGAGLCQPGRAADGQRAALRQRRRPRAGRVAITAIMTGQAYKTSAEIASRVGTFTEYMKNREPFLRVHQ